MHSSRMIKLLKENNIEFVNVYPHTEKVKLLDGTICRLKELIKKPSQVPISDRYEEVPEPHKDSEVPFEVIEVIDTNQEKHIETEKIIKKPKKKLDK